MRNSGATQLTERTMETSTTDLDSDAVAGISGALRQLLADVFVLYVKTKNFHWHMSGRHFRDYHLLLDEHSDQIFAMTDVIAERARKIGTPTRRSIGEIHGTSGCRTTTMNLSPRRTCWRSSLLTTGSSHYGCVQRMRSANSTAMSLPAA